MPSITLHTTSTNTTTNTTNPLPNLIQTPSGLALLEIQGTIHAPFPSPSENSSQVPPKQTPIGQLEFPLYDLSSNSDKWTKKVYLYIGKHQRLTGEVKKLAKTIAVVRKREATEMEGADAGREGGEELEIVEIVRWKILFAGRPEPVGGDEV